MFDFNPTTNLITGSYDIGLVLLSYLIAVFASFSTLYIFSHFKYQTKISRLWLSWSAFVMGGGIWAMHFIGMLSFKIPLLVEFDIRITLLSFLVATVGSGCAFYIACKDLAYKTLLGGIVMGIGIATMHYTGMAGMQIEAVMHYDATLFTLSIFIAIGAATVAIWISITSGINVSKNRFLINLTSSLIMGIAIIGMHYTGMAATFLEHTGNILPEPTGPKNSGFFAITITVITILILLTVVFSLRYTQKQKQLNEAQARAILESVIDPLITIDEMGVIESFNPAAERTFGYVTSEVIGKNVKILMPDPYHSEHDEYLQNYRDTRQAKIIGIGREVVGQRKDGSVFPLELAINEIKIGYKILYVGICRDITERKHAEISLQESESKFRQLAENIEEVFWMEDVLSEEIIYISPAFEKVWGLRCEDLLKNPQLWMESIHPEDHRKISDRGLYSDGKQESEGQFQSEFRIIRPDGAVRWIWDRAFPVYNDLGEVIRIAGISEDITERKQMEEMSSRFGRILEDSFNEIFLFEAQNFKFTRVNQGARQNLGYTMEELRNMTPVDIKPKISREKFEIMIQPLKDGTKNHLVFETFHQRKNGTEYPVEVRLQLAQHENPPQFLAIIQDITERKRAVEAIEKAHRDLEEQNYLKTNLTNLNNKLRGDQGSVELSQNIINCLAEIMEANIGAIYLAESDVLKRTAGFAFTQKEDIPNEFNIGESLVGQAALEKKNIAINDVPEDYIRVTSGLGDALPSHIIIVPLLYADTLMGVVELGSLKPFSDRQLKFLKQAEEGIAIALNSSLAQGQAAKLLSETQAQAKELISQKEKLEQIQEEMQQTNQSLEKQTYDLVNQKNEIEEKNALIKLKVKELKLAGKYKSEFLANMSHELRTPLNSLLILSHLLAKNKEQNLTEKQIEYIQTINSSGTDLLNLINDILDLSKVEAGQMELHQEDVSLGALADSAKNLFRHMVEQKGVKFKTEIRPGTLSNIRTDAQRLEQVIKNLLSNAFKFTEKGSIILKFHPVEPGVRFSRAELNNQNVIGISVSDTGKGISRDKQDQIFEAFRQEDGTTSRKYGGTGLGLSISKELVHILGGEMNLESKEGEGSTFTVYLPETFPAQEPLGYPEEIKAIKTLPKHHNKSKKKSGPKSLLVVEDGDVMRVSISGFFNNEKVKIIKKSTADEALHELRKLNIDCMILDLGFDGHYGFDVLHEIKGDGNLSKIPVIVYTGKKLSKNEEEELAQLSKSVIIKEAQSPKRLMEETNRFLYGINEVPEEKEYAKAGELKVKKQRAMEEEYTEEGNPFFQGKRILLADDNMRNIFALTHLLEENGINVVRAGNGREAIEILKSDSNIDLILMDIMMPVMDGYEAIKEIRKKNNKYKEIPIIALTAKAMKTDKKKCLDAGASDYLAKPIDQVKLFIQLKALLQNKKHGR